MRLLTAEQMRDADARAGARVGMSELMRRAGTAVTAAAPLVATTARRIVAFAGPGNNGGDAFAAMSQMDGSLERIIYAAPAPRTTEARHDAERSAANAGVVVRPWPEDNGAFRAAARAADLLIDALLGTGSRAQPDAMFVPAIEAMNAAAAPVLSIDIPTGIDPTTGAVAGVAVRATATVTLGAAKLGLVLQPARSHAGNIYLGDIGIAADEIDAVPGDHYAAIECDEFLRLLPSRGPESDKRSAGAPLIVAGSPQFPGAAVLCSLGAARAGAGYVTVATPQSVAETLRTHLVEQVVMTYDESDAAHTVDALVDLTNHSSAVGIGPGLGLGNTMGEIVRGFVQRLTLPFVADASAFFHFSKHLDVLRGKRCVITPHEREFARLSGEGTVQPGTRIARLRSFVGRTGITTLLKGASTLIFDGTTMHVNVTGTPALATAGTGDVLTGIVATLLSQGLAPVDAARAGAYWHGLAGRAAALRRPIGVIAGDVADALAVALPASADSSSVLRLVAPA